MSEDTSRIPISKRHVAKSSVASTSHHVEKKTEHKKEEPIIEPSKKEPNKSKNTPRSSGKMLFGGLLIALLVGFGLYYGMIVKSVKDLSRADFIVTSAELFKIPVAKVNGEKILYTDYVDNMQAMEQFYETDDTGMPTPTDEQMSDYVLSRLVVNTLIVQEAGKLDVSVSDETVNEVVEQQILTNFESREKAEGEIITRYGWDFDGFVNKIVRPTELEKAVAQAYIASLGPKDNTDVEQRAKDILQQIKDGSDFAELAKEHGSDATKEQGGDLGWFGRGVMVAPFEEAVFALEAGQVADELVETQFGYHIVKVDEKRTVTDEETDEDVEEIKARHILFPTASVDVNDFREYMNQKLVNARIEVLETVHNPFEELQAEIFNQNQQQVQPEVNVEVETDNDAEVNVELEPADMPQSEE